MQNDFRARALAAGFALVGIDPLFFFTSKNGGPEMFHGLTQWWAPFLLSTTICLAAAALLSLWFRPYRRACLAAAGEVTFILGGWSVAQYPYIISPDITLSQAATPAATLGLLIVALGLGSIVLLPSLFFLFRIFKGRAAH